MQANHVLFAELSKDDLSEKINKALMDTGCISETRPCAPGLNGSDGVEHNTPHIHAVCQHHSGYIWLAAYSKAEHSFLIGMAHCWVPQLSDQLSVTQKMYLVLVHGMPANFDLSCGSDNTRHLIAQNNHWIVHLAVFRHAKFLSQTCAASQHKAHGSLVIYFMDTQTVNDCITHPVAYQVKFYQQSSSSVNHRSATIATVLVILCGHAKP